MLCPDCQHENPSGAKFCSECGTRLPSGCLQCGTALVPNARFCFACGALVGSGRPVTPSPLAPPAPVVVGTALGTPTLGLEAQFAAMRQAMPTALQGRLLAEADGENRLLTILFSDLTSSVKTTAHLAPEDAAALVNEVLKAMVDAVLEHDGRISRLLGDGMLALFGTPLTHESDPERAILAAMRIRESVRKLGLNVTAGINTGEVYLGAVGGEGHREITAMGAAINLAARLREHAQPGEIVIGEATYHHTRRAFALSPRLVEAKGFPAPVRAYLVERRLERPEKVRGVEGLHAELIGRDEELGKLVSALDEVRSGRGQLVSIIGEAGVGKSRLVADLSQAALADAERAPRWFEGRCLDIGMAVSYWPFLDFFRSCFGWRVEDDEAERAARLVTTLSRLVQEGSLSTERYRELVPLIADLLSVELGEDWPTVSHASAEQARQQTMLAIRDVVLALARRGGLVLVLDDLHWADSSSLDMVSLLMESLTLAPLLLVCAYRPDPEHRSRHLGTVGARKCADRYTEIRLRELTPRQSRQLIASLLQIEDLSPEMAQLILEKAQGNPFFVEEVVRALIEAGAVYRDDEGAWRARPELGGVAVPESIQGVILSRVDRLQNDSRRVLQSASVIGRVFRRRLLARVANHEADLDQALAELEERALIYEGRVTPEPEYSFQHQLTQETVYRNLLRRQRQGFHRQVAEAIEALYADGLDEFYEQLAYHYDRADDAARAVEYLVKAGQKAATQYANREAVTHFDRALELTTTDAAAEPIRLLRGQSHLGLFHGREACEDFEWLLDRAEARGDRRAELEAILGLGQAYYQRGLDDQHGQDMALCRATCERGLALARELGDGPRAARILITMVHFAELWNETFEQSREYAREALRLARESGDPELILEGRLMASRWTPMAEAVAEAEALAIELEASGNLTALNHLCFDQMIRYTVWGDFERGIATCDRAIAVAARLGVPPVQYPTIKAHCLMMLGRFGEGWRTLQTEVVGQSHPFGLAFREFGEGVYYLDLGANERAALTLRRVAEQAVKLNRDWMYKAANSARACAELRAGTLDWEWVRQLWDYLDWHWSPLSTVIATAEILLAQGDSEAALERLDVVAAQAKELDLRPRAVAGVELRSRVLLSLGRAEEALAAAEEALPLTREMNYRPVLWRLLGARAAALAALDRQEEASVERRAAAAIVQEMADTVEDEELRRGFLASPEVMAVVGG